MSSAFLSIIRMELQNVEKRDLWILKFDVLEREPEADRRKILRNQGGARGSRKRQNPHPLVNQTPKGCGTQEGVRALRCRTRFYWGAISSRRGTLKCSVHTPLKSSVALKAAVR